MFVTNGIATNMFVSDGSRRLSRVRDEHVRYGGRVKSSVKSRRDRPAKRALSLEWIVAETIEIMRAEGLEKVTMRRVAQALDTGPASLYVYVANTAELHALVLDQLLGTIELQAGGSWQGRLEALLASYADILFTYPGLARSALVHRPTGANAIRLYDLVLGLLIEGEMPPDRAAWGVDLLLQYVTSNAAEHSAPTPGDADAPRDEPGGLDTVAAALRATDAGTAPHVAAHVEALVSGTPAERVSWAIHVLLAGIASVPTPAAG
jgi:AcrR family transcriptional regulator